MDCLERRKALADPREPRFPRFKECFAPLELYIGCDCSLLCGIILLHAVPHAILRPQLGFYLLCYTYFVSFFRSFVPLISHNLSVTI